MKKFRTFSGSGVIRDAHREIQDNRHGSFAEAVIAALSAEPETIEELDAALERFIARDEESYFEGFSSDIVGLLRYSRFKAGAGA